MNRTRWNLLTAIMLICGLAWIWANRVPDDAAGPADAARSLTPAPLIGYPAPDIALTTITGATFELSSLRGTPVVLNFWATWCPPCRAEMPELRQASAQYQGQVAIVAVNQAELADEVRSFAADLDLTFMIPLDSRAESSQAYGVRSLPTTFFIDRAGVIREIQVGPLTAATLAQLLRTIYP